MIIKKKDINWNQDTNKQDGCTEYKGGLLIWNRNGLLHREDGPAIIWRDGSKFWYLNGFLHREDGPAVILADGTERWWVDDVFQRSNSSFLEFDWKKEGF